MFLGLNAMPLAWDRKYIVVGVGRDRAKSGPHIDGRSALSKLLTATTN
jgi:hypothetical protein